MFIICRVPAMGVSDSVYNKTILLFPFSENRVVYANSVDPDELSHYDEFHLFTKVQVKESSDSGLIL